MASLTMNQIIKWILALLVLILLILFTPGISDGGQKVLSWTKNLWKIDDNKPVKPPAETSKPREDCAKHDSYSSCFEAMDKGCIVKAIDHTTSFEACVNCEDFEVYCTDVKLQGVCNNHPCKKNCIWVQGLKLYIPPNTRWWQKLYRWSIPFSGRCFDNDEYTTMQDEMVANGFISGKIRFAEGEIIEKELDTPKLISYVSKDGDVLVISKVASNDKKYYVYIKEGKKPATAYDSKGNAVPEKQEEAEKIIKNRKVIG